MAEKAAYIAPGMTVAELELAISQGTQLAEAAGTVTTNAVALARIDLAITTAGLAAATWDAMDWWWLHSTGSFATAEDTASYALRTVNEADMADLWSVDRAYYDDERVLEWQSWADYQNWYRLLRPDANTTKPFRWAITGEPPVMHLAPVPDDEYTINIDYTRRHSKITNAGSLDTALIVPAEFQWGIYVGGAQWLLKHDTFDPASLRDCPPFVEAIQRMMTADPAHRTFDHDADKFRDVQGTVPWDQKTHQTGGGISLLTGKPSIT